MIGNNPYFWQQGMPRAGMRNTQASVFRNAWVGMDQRAPTWGRAASSTGGIIPPHMRQQMGQHVPTNYFRAMTFPGVGR